MRCGQAGMLLIAMTLYIKIYISFDTGSLVVRFDGGHGGLFATHAGSTLLLLV